ncbi:hypothetical protein ACSMFR_04105 [Listeria aquatica]|uniref:hypothetical protein n=1 Tax=Listeria aquatica TaxID=1494960 RepID=UPI003F700486
MFIKLIKRNFSQLNGRHFLGFVLPVLIAALFFKSYSEIFKGIHIETDLSVFEIPFVWLLFEWAPYFLFLDLFAETIHSIDRYLLGRVKTTRLLFYADFISFFGLILFYHLALYVVTFSFSKDIVMHVLFNLITNFLVSLLAFCLLFFLSSIYVFTCIIAIYFFSVFQPSYFSLVNYTMGARMNRVWETTDTIYLAIWVVLIFFLVIWLKKSYFRVRLYE